MYRIVLAFIKATNTQFVLYDQQGPTIDGTKIMCNMAVVNTVDYSYVRLWVRID